MNVRTTECEDGSLLIEWTDSGVRFGISIEPNLTESSWYYINRREQYSDSDTLPLQVLEKLHQHLSSKGSSFLAETYAREKEIEAEVCTRCGAHHVAVINDKGLTGICPNCDLVIYDNSKESNNARLR